MVQKSIFYLLLLLIVINICDGQYVTKFITNNSNYENETIIIDSNNTDCECYNVTDEPVECRCFGKSLKIIPNNLNGNIEKLTISDANIRIIRKDDFTSYQQTLKDITLGNLPLLEKIEKGSFNNIPNLRTLYISHVPQLKNLHGLLMGITSRKFYSLRIVQTGLEEIPDLSFLHSENVMHLLDLDSNNIKILKGNSIQTKAEQVTLNYNKITVVENFAFNGSQIGKLNLRGNKSLKILMKYAFAGLESLRELDLSQTSIENLPTAGISDIEILRIEETPFLKIIPSIYDLENLKLAKLTHSFHCCAFKYPEQHDPQKHAMYEENIRKACQEFTMNMDNEHNFQDRRKRRRRKRNISNNWIYEKQYQNIPPKRSSIIKEWTPNVEYFSLLANESEHADLNPLFGQTIDHEDAKPVDEYEDFGVFHANVTDTVNSKKILAFCGNFSILSTSVKCFPEPNALNPCEDIMGFSWLRISVWFVLVLAMFGNLAVIVVILFSGGELTVSRFLICNLAFADFCMGLYLLLIAIMDLHSMGTYFNFAFDWQYGIGCKISGFLTVFASHLSIFTLTIITIERWFAITHAIHLTRRIRIGNAIKIMVGGWLYSIFVAALPLFGVNNYSSTSICLPMEVNRLIDRIYLISLIIVNALGFALIVYFYIQIYLSLGYETRHINNKGEMTIAKKMALLIFTDFATWAPISFFSITALAGYPLIGVTKSKILLVFFYPINSCANPYLYAIMTAQYRKDFFIMISRCGICQTTAHQYTVTTTFPLSHNNSQPIPLLVRDANHGNPTIVPTKPHLDDEFV